MKKTKRNSIHSTTGRSSDINLPKPKAKKIKPDQSSVSKEASKHELKDIEKSKIKTKVYIYLQLRYITNIPTRPGDIEMELHYNGEPIPRLDKECTKCRLMHMDEQGCYVTFSFPIFQDSVEDLNIVSDNPILITLYETVVHSDSGEKEKKHKAKQSHSEQIVIAQGYIDILAYFSKKRFSASIDTFIYPIDKDDQMTNGTCKASWQIYSLLPLLKDVEFSNLIFINFESIYNCTDDLFEDSDDLRAELAFRSLLPNESGQMDVLQICNFSGFTRKIIKEQNPNFVWESAKQMTHYTNESFGFHSDSKVNVYRLFHRLLCPEGKSLSLNDIDIELEEALICNSMHRFILTEELRSLLEDVFIFRQQELVVRIYRNDSPEDILLEGALEPSIFLYPLVNAVRFAVALSPVTNLTGKTQKPKPKKDNHSSGDFSPKTIFGIVSMCLLTPLTEELHSLAKHTKGLQVEKVKYCHRMYEDETMAPLTILRERAYDSFDDWVFEVVDYIVKNNVREIGDAQNFLCCQAQNATNKILALVALDFNQRVPTKNNIEFCNLMTTVYKELENRVHKNIEICGTKDIQNCRIQGKTTEDYIISLMNFVKMEHEIGDETLSKLIFKKLEDHYSKNIDFNFYMFLNDAENGAFEQVKKYIDKPPKERKLKDEYFIQFLNIYVQYMENLQNEETYNEALEKLLGNLTQFLKYYIRDGPGWILLYCLYKSSGYLPGMEFARWHYEDLNSKFRVLENIPMTRWQLHLNYEIKFTSIKGIDFYKTVKMFQTMGAYKFAEIVFNEISKECADIDRYLENMTLKVLLGEVNSNCNPREFPEMSSSLAALVNHVNGHLLYTQNDKEQALTYYESLIDLIYDDDEIIPYELGLRRYANQMMDDENYHKALRALQKFDLQDSSVAVSFMMGKSYYKTGHLKEALESFKLSTEKNVHVPDVWAYLALIHLKMGQNFEALECWKYAKHNPDVIISDEILNELNKINPADVYLYVDKPY